MVSFMTLQNSMDENVKTIRHLITLCGVGHSVECEG